MEDYQRQTDLYNVIYKTPGQSDRSAMPLGNGRVGISLWVEAEGNLQFYIGHTDAQSEVDRNLKLGKVVVSLDPNPFAGLTEFTQELHLRQGCVQISARNASNAVKARVFVDAAADAIYIEIDSAQPLQAAATLQTWRTAEKAPWAIPDLEGEAGAGEAEVIRETADQVFRESDGIVFYHKNGRTCVKSTAILEALAGHLDKINDTLENRTFGGFMTLDGGMARGQDSAVSQAAATRHQILVSTFCVQAADTAELIGRVISGHQAAPDLATAAARTAAHWDHYFSQSYLFVQGDRPAVAPVPEDIARVALEPDDVLPTPSKVTQSYLLTKYLFACSASGRIPIYFNGLIFNLMPGLNRHLSFAHFCQTFAAQPAGQPDLEINPDEKGWESCINLWQNVRLPYAAMLQRGEFAAIRGLFDYYRAFWEINKVKAAVYYGAAGQYNTEMTNSFGLMPVSVYGADRTGLKDGYAANRWGGAVDISPGLELCFLMLDFYNFTRDAAFLQHDLLPYAGDLFHFIETRFRERQDGKLLLTGLQCVETYFDTTNPITVVAGMQAVVAKILALPPELVENREIFSQFPSIIPELPLEQDGQGNPVLAPALDYENKRMNVESPQLYAIYPFRLFTRYQGYGPLIRDTYRHAVQVAGCFQPHRFESPPGVPCYAGWQYLGMVTALLGMADETAEILVNNCALKNPGHRFPAMWGPVYDAVPDGDHGANLTNILQLMALQVEDDQIWLLPAWPADWDISFKLFAGNQTTVACEYRNGRIVSLVVTPAERLKDVVSPQFPLPD